MESVKYMYEDDHEIPLMSYPITNKSLHIFYTFLRVSTYVQATLTTYKCSHLPCNKNVIKMEAYCNARSLFRQSIGGSLSDPHTTSNANYGAAPGYAWTNANATYYATCIFQAF